MAEVKRQPSLSREVITTITTQKDCIVSEKATVKDTAMESSNGDQPASVPRRYDPDLLIGYESDSSLTSWSSSSSPPIITRRAHRTAARRADRAKKQAAGKAAEQDRLREEETKKWISRLRKRPPVVDYREVDYEHFKNRYGLDDGLHIIEVLRASPTTPDDIEAERILRSTMGRSPAQEHPTKVMNPGASWSQRIRINSDVVLDHLATFSGPGGEWLRDGPRTFFRPFRCLLYYQPQMHKALRDLEEKWAELEQLDDNSGQETEAVEKQVEQTRVGEDEKGDGSDSEGAREEEETDSNAEGPTREEGVAALRHLRCYVNFVEKHLKPLENLFDGTSRTRVRFNDLDLLFKPGDLVYSPHWRSTSVRSGRDYQSLWRIYHVSRPYYGRSQLNDTRLDLGGDVLQLCSYSIDYNGESFGPVKAKHRISAYGGEKDITDLPVYPLRFADGADRIRAELKRQGSSFLSCVTQNHMYYEGWTIPVQRKSSGGESNEGPDDPPEHIDSAVILDFVEAFKHNPGWKPKTTKIGTRTQFHSKGLDKFQLAHWSDRDRGELWYSASDLTQRQDGVHVHRKNDYLNDHDAFVQATRSGALKLLENEEDIMLLPRRVAVYALRERRFLQVDVLSLHNPAEQRALFRDLKINPSHKRMLKSLVEAHFRNRHIQRQHPLVRLNQDIIQGKGSGLFILLHGVPGVGKTATAEAIAHEKNQPLFHITCGDLGFTPKEVEGELKEIFRLAHLWDCVLLLDEADIFLARRDMTNLKRNALVSVFLRVLEYYSGILFLTTNRVGTLDEAFKSRIHISLYYERLNLKRTLAIFDVNIRHLKEIEEKKERELADSDMKEPSLQIKRDSILRFAEWHYKNTSQSVRWNGRQIRNAFQIASSLARYDVHKNAAGDFDSKAKKQGESNKGVGESDPEPVLDERHFELVSEAIERFDNYFFLATGERDEDTARREMVREDHARHEDLLQVRPKRDPPSPRATSWNRDTPSRSKYDGKENRSPKTPKGNSSLLSSSGRSGRSGGARGRDTREYSSSFQERDHRAPSVAGSRRDARSHKYMSEEDEDEEKGYYSDEYAAAHWYEGDRGHKTSARRSRGNRGTYEDGDGTYREKHRHDHDDDDEDDDEDD
ncbi:hypothetical protein JDV02_008081 [Purpureocillium takamizusanense]|uniref:AAA+ ATPase domain-containing protein n=1 Tax=Purpureocillium takamizusanense TaxID=2060973 RepID=A0A9Q8QMY1_9HYPO|nr:uncharacterized protein JDV02_008081 [Purpureocillium takamizusanense]UNI22167.1 hypothetical protein JDV02_008081 [Purpureocillium takamizusanense]